MGWPVAMPSPRSAAVPTSPTTKGTTRSAILPPGRGGTGPAGGSPGRVVTATRCRAGRPRGRARRRRAPAGPAAWRAVGRRTGGRRGPSAPGGGGAGARGGRRRSPRRPPPGAARRRPARAGPRDRPAGPRRGAWTAGAGPWRAAGPCAPGRAPAAPPGPGRRRARQPRTGCPGP
ncbi:hypothetical protein [Ornithinimicrobium kibberense]|uniref:hypothetical protein n=1 Tax=Ornithinimicrobium kibberense TaxID=282060 RepID=UPI00361219BA